MGYEAEGQSAEPDMTSSFDHYAGATAATIEALGDEKAEDASPAEGEETTDTPVAPLGSVPATPEAEAVKSVQELAGSQPAGSASTTPTDSDVDPIDKDLAETEAQWAAFEKQHIEAQSALRAPAPSPPPAAPPPPRSLEQPVPHAPASPYPEGVDETLLSEGEKFLYRTIQAQQQALKQLSDFHAKTLESQKEAQQRQWFDGRQNRAEEAMQAESVKAIFQNPKVQAIAKRLVEAELWRPNANGNYEPERAVVLRVAKELRGFQTQAVGEALQKKVQQAGSRTQTGGEQKATSPPAKKAMSYREFREGDAIIQATMRALD